MALNYGEILEKSWKIIWKHKVLWIFGLLASCAQGGGGSGGGGGRGSAQFSGNNFQDGFSFNLPPAAENFLHQLTVFFNSENAWIIIVVLVLVALLFALIFFVLSIFGRIGLVRGAWQADESDEKLSFGQLWRQSRPYFWRVLLVMLLGFAVSLAIVAILIVPAILISVLTLGIGIFCLLIPLVCLLIPVFWALSVLLEQSIVAIVGEDLGVIEGVKRGWQVIRDNLGQMVVMSLILLIGPAILRFVIFLPFLLALLPVVLALLAQSQNVLMAGLAISLVLFLLYLLLAIVINAILQAYLGTAWTLTFRRLAGRPAAATEEPVVMDAPSPEA